MRSSPAGEEVLRMIKAAGVPVPTAPPDTQGFQDRLETTYQEGPVDNVPFSSPRGPWFSRPLRVHNPEKLTTAQLAERDTPLQVSLPYQAKPYNLDDLGAGLAAAVPGARVGGVSNAADSAAEPASDGRPPYLWAHPASGAPIAYHEVTHLVDPEGNRRVAPAPGQSKAMEYEDEIPAMVVEGAAAHQLGGWNAPNANWRDAAIQKYGPQGLTGDPKLDVANIKEWVTKFRDPKSALGSNYQQWLKTELAEPKAIPAPVKPAPAAPIPKASVTTPAPVSKAPTPIGTPQTKAAAELLDMIKVAGTMPTPNPVQWAKDYPTFFGAPALAVSGGALGALYHVLRKKMDPNYKGSLVANTAAGLGLGTVAGAGLLASQSPHLRAALDPGSTDTRPVAKRVQEALKYKLDQEIEAGKYDRQGPFRQGLRAVRPLIPSRPGTHEYPADFKANVKEPITDLPDTVALGGKVAPNDTRIQVSSPMAPAEGLWRKGFEGGKPREFFTLDDKLTKLLGPPKDSTSYTGSEILGSKSQYDYNDGLSGTFGPRPEARVRPTPLRPTDNSLVLAGHGSGNPLSSVAGVGYVDILKQLAEKGHLKGINDLHLQTCNTAGCDIPNDVVKAALGRTPQRVTYTPPGATSVAAGEEEHLHFIRAPGADKTRLMDSELLRPRRITTVHSRLGAIDGPRARQTLVQPVVPTAATRWFADQADRFGTPVLKHFMKDPAVVGRSIRNATKIHDYATDYGDASAWDTTATTLPKLKTQFPKWFPNE